MVQNLVQVRLVDVTVVNCQRKTLSAKATCSSNAMQVVLRIALDRTSAVATHEWNIKVDDDLHLGDVNASSEHIGSNNH